MRLDRRSLLTFGVALPIMATSARPVRAGSSDVFARDGVAISGYDTVAYFKHGAPVMGHPEHSLIWRGAVWQFSDGASMQAFEMNPMGYAPKYGGYCAYAMSKGAVAPTVPEAFTIHEDQLYLNFSTDVRAIWKRDIPGNVALADAHWPAALNR
jgi:hypothetical protein